MLGIEKNMSYKFLFNNRFKPIKYGTKYAILDAKERIIWCKNEKCEYTVGTKIELIDDKQSQELVRDVFQKSIFANEIVDKQLEDDENDLYDYYTDIIEEYRECIKEKEKKNMMRKLSDESSYVTKQTSNKTTNSLTQFLTYELANARVHYDVKISETQKFEDEESTYYLTEYRSRKSGKENEITHLFWGYKDDDAKCINYFYNQLEKELTKWKEDFSRYTICVVPKSDAGVINENTANGCVAKKLSEKFGFANATGTLVRHTSIKSVHEGGDRSEDTHLDSIKFDERFKELVNGKECVLFDDIVTSGNTLRACSDILIDNGAKKVYKLTLGKTM